MLSKTELRLAAFVCVLLAIIATVATIRVESNELPPSPLSAALSDAELAAIPQIAAQWAENTNCEILQAEGDVDVNVPGPGHFLTLKVGAGWENPVDPAASVTLKIWWSIENDSDGLPIWRVMDQRTTRMGQLDENFNWIQDGDSGEYAGNSILFSANAQVSNPDQILYPILAELTGAGINEQLLALDPAYITILEFDPIDDEEPVE